jgi:quinol monooxygenase YgiN
MSHPVHIFASFVPKEGEVHAVREVLLGMRVASLQEPGCRQYDMFSAETDGRTSFHLMETYADADAVQAHRDTQHYKNYRAEIGNLIEGQVGVLMLTEVQ